LEEVVSNIKKAAKEAVLAQLKQAKATHKRNIRAFKIETNSSRKEKILADLQDSALKLGVAKHKAKYYGLAD